ncbi:MAG TPA: threonine/serine exporter family protein [Lachnospiraceae bacterium]|nr:threonine/serine exporter family protein [Lachnospiraceae bacterium]
MMQTIYQSILAFLGALGFSFLFNVRGKKVLASAVGAVLSQNVYLVFVHLYDDKVIGVFAAAITVAVLSEILARIMKTPVIILLVPMLIPLIPGSDLYYATYNLVQNNGIEFAKNLSFVIKEAGAISFGIILVTCVVQVVMKIWNYFRTSGI